MKSTRQLVERGFVDALVGDGFFPLLLTGVALAGSGGFALFLSATGHFLPHDVAYLGLDAMQLSRVSNPRLVNFMFHDRAAFGGSLVAVGLLYLWLAEFPLRQGESWAWWTLALSGTAGFGSFLSYLGYGYLDTWHGVATLVLLRVFLIGTVRTHRLLKAEKSKPWAAAVAAAGAVPGSATRGKMVAEREKGRNARHGGSATRGMLSGPQGALYAEHGTRR